MSEVEVRQARIEVEKSAAEFERALDQLRVQVEDGVEAARELGSKVKEPSELFDEFLDNAVEYAKKSARELFKDIRAAALEEFDRLEKRPLAPWATAFGTGLAMGFLIAKGTRSREVS